MASYAPVELLQQRLRLLLGLPLTKTTRSSAKRTSR